MKRFFRRLRRKFLVFFYGSWKKRFHRCCKCGKPVLNEWEGMRMPHTFQDLHDVFCEEKK